MTEYKIELTTNNFHSEGGAPIPGPAFRVHRAQHGRVAVAPQWPHLGVPEAGLIRLLQELRHDLASGQIDVDGRIDLYPLTIPPAEYGIADDRWEKRCAWRLDTGRDLHCAAVSTENHTAQAVSVVEGQMVLETDLVTCRRCEVQDERLLCDAFSHPKNAVDGSLGEEKPGHPHELFGATCRQGNPEIADAGECRPGGNHCWHQEVEVTVGALQPAGAVQLLEAFDFLDSEWRHTYPAQRLVRITSIAETAQLLSPVNTRDDFMKHVGRLGEVLQKLRVDGGLFEESAERGSLKRLGQWANEHAPAALPAIE